MLIGPLLRLTLAPASRVRDWRGATSRPVGLAPDPHCDDRAIVQVYAAPAFGWRGAFAVHCWIAAKEAGGSRYRRYEVIGWNLYRRQSVITESHTRAPDAEWYGSRPTLLRDLRGAAAEDVLRALPAAVASYPHPWLYRAWPGPNSNSFIAHVGRQIPALRLALPGNALGKDYLTGRARFFARAPSGTGVQISIAGVIGVLAAWEEGLELNLLGLTLGLDLRRASLTLPGFGRISVTARGNPR